MPNASLSFSVAAGARVPGARLAGARYTLKRRLGRGRFSDVWLARDRTREEDIALKFLPEPLLKNTGFIEQLQREIQRAAKLDHPAILRIFDFVQDRENLGVAMEYVDGWSLSVLKADRPQKRYSLEEIRPWVWQLCTALEYAHCELGLVHGDLRPANLYLNAREQLRMADYALNPILHSALAHPGYLASGALPYLSPQQVKGCVPNAPDDIYSLGATIYDLLTGTPPFFKGDIRAQVAETVPPPMTGRLVQLEIDGGFPQSWDETIAACLAKEPAHRPQSVAQVRQRLEPTVAGGPPIKEDSGGK
ncbi:MAG TPA: serine/threonine-protein kinase [Candidatus Binatia bacterium]|jgi:serine/threonine protein kinase|nr:serine/threonine-protein kinase [Candidatus Binatia bacterium]